MYVKKSFKNLVLKYATDIIDRKSPIFTKAASAAKKLHRIVFG